ncbi:leucyl-tRNA synthetase [Arcanobacterium wilhelmae]|uniref:Leucine--tRNA ligase n=1 Tax=Arcanobacterium wilhelmae TaxID=1803177 RepID=A0ABT9NDU4_9ACTO|nr:leucine--tRNA ligase [Arcanobacterium wilhelmae]MDP9801690.1 leucyl-tRNA synthetase [Arcanobacterium wilhelmae]WFN91010.1 leucine--tRNA ligase [Arcanobacterium wilhelmae]
MSEFRYRYTAELANEIEAKWQNIWESDGTFNAPNPVGELAGDTDKEAFFLLDMFPFPSGKGLHVGHPLGYIATDTVARYQRMLGKNVLYTMGYDAFGLPAEQYAVETGQHPRVTTEENIANMRRQLRLLGLSHEQRRSLATTDIEFVKWTQWIFLQIFNSWYDAEAPGREEGTVGRARPISELIVGYEDGSIATPSGKAWSEMSSDERREAVDSRRLAYIENAPVNWAPGLGTVLANEEVTADGRSERGNFPVFKRELSQWMMRITAYADRLAEDLDTVDWPEKVRAMQRNWIGKSRGADVDFTAHHEGGDETLTVFTTRPDTLFGATFMVVSPEHPMLKSENLPAQWPAGTREAWMGGASDPRTAVHDYQIAASRKSDMDRADAEKEKTGVFTGIFATNPVTGTDIPVFTGDYVMMGYGTGAIMAVPAHDERDFAFATKFDLDIVRTIAAPEDFPADQAYTGDGAIIDSSNDSVSLDGLDKAAGKARMIEWLEAEGKGKEAISYRLRDWLFSRQRYWGEPFPVVYDEEGNVHALPESMLPVELPDTPDYSPRSYDPDDAESNPEPPLGRLTDWVNVELDLGDGVKKYKRDTNTMPNWAGSCWYEIRYIDPHDDDEFVAAQNEAYWMGPREGKASGGADLYVGGVEHAVLHLLYARFWQKVLFDLGYVSSSEPFHKLFNQGYVQAYAYTDSRGAYVPAENVVEVPASDGSGEVTWEYNGEKVNREYGKMGKSLKNIVTPDYMAETYGADTFRVYEMSMGPLDIDRPWETRAVVGAQRFLQRLWRNVVDEETGDVLVTDEQMPREMAQQVARTIDFVRGEYENMRINTAIAKLIELNNYLTGKDVPREAAEAIVLMTSPVAPHIAEELWSRLGHEGSLAHEPFPQVEDPSLLVDDQVTAVFQVKGKVRDRAEVPADISADDLEKLALASEKVRKFLDGEPRKVIVRAPKIVNIVP